MAALCERRALREEEVVVEVVEAIDWREVFWSFSSFWWLVVGWTGWVVVAGGDDGVGAGVARATLAAAGAAVVVGLLVSA